MHKHHATSIACPSLSIVSCRVSVVSRVQTISWRLGCELQTGCWQECSCLWEEWGRRGRSKCSWHPRWSHLRWVRLSLCSSGMLELSDGLEKVKRKEWIKFALFSSIFLLLHLLKWTGKWSVGYSLSYPRLSHIDVFSCKQYMGSIADVRGLPFDFSG